MFTKFWPENVKGRDHLRDLSIVRCKWEDNIKMDLKESVCGLNSSGSG
jgi:hypothetical protein